MTRYSLERVGLEEAVRWDELVLPYSGRQLFHRRAWLEYLSASRGIEVRMLGIREGDRTVGYYAGGLIKKGPFRILGSPLKGWGTNYLGPAAGTDLDEAALVRALDDLARQERVSMAELEHPSLSETVMTEAGYRPQCGQTYIVPLKPDDPEAFWLLLRSNRRTNVRKAIRSGLIVEDTDDPAVADEFYDQYTDLMRHKGKVPPYPRAYPRLLFAHLRPADMLFALRIKDGTGRVLATGLFPHDDRTVYFWGGASWQDGRDLYPNDLLHASLMRLAATRGIRTYDMCGFGRFKRDFGGTLITTRRWHKSYTLAARLGRRAYAAYFRARMDLLGWLGAVAKTED